MQTINLDEGYFFGLGAFETIAIHQGHPILLSYHLERLEKALNFFSINHSISSSLVKQFLSESGCQNGVLKITVSKENLFYTVRQNPYTPKHYEKGFRLEFSKIRRNETSPLTFLKSLNYADNILEKHTFVKQGIDEPIFLNTKGALTEGACSNLFFVKDEQLYTPIASSGLLNGTIRRYLLNEFTIQELEIFPEFLNSCTEIFVTNSLMGIMPVYRVGTQFYPKHKITNQILKHYQQAVLNGQI